MFLHVLGSTTDTENQVLLGTTQGTVLTRWMSRVPTLLPFGVSRGHPVTLITFNSGKEKGVNQRLGNIRKDKPCVLIHF